MSIRDKSGIHAKTIVFDWSVSKTKIFCNLNLLGSCRRIKILVFKKRYLGTLSYLIESVVLFFDVVVLFLFTFSLLLIRRILIASDANKDY